MPLYEYQCRSCGHRFESIQKFSDPPVESCPSCGGPVRKLLSSPAIQFKGSGWYVTDYARKERPDKAEKAEKPDASKPEAAGAEKSSSASTPSSPLPGSTSKDS